MKKYIGRIAYIAVGVVLLTGSVATKSRGLSDADKAIYELALGQQKWVDTLGFEDFQLADYPVAFFDGKKDYVVTAKEEGYSIEKREPVLNTFAGTAYEVDGHYEVIVPTVDKLSELIELAGSAGKVQEMTEGGEISEKEDVEVSTKEDTYGEKEQTATIWHEAFHAYQFTKAEEQIEAMLAGHTFAQGDLGEDVIVAQIDENKEQKELFEKQLAVLKEAVLATEVDTLKELILEYQRLEEQRTAMLSEEAKILEAYYKRVEGSAHYEEAYVYKKLYSEEAFQTRYVGELDTFRGGSSKYYSVGMAECLILDKLNENWKSEYDFSKSFLEVIREYMSHR